MVFRINLIMLLVFSGVLICSCGSDDNSAGPSNDPQSDLNTIMPLALGNRWVYLERDMESPPDSLRDTVSVTSQQEVAGVVWYVVKRLDDQQWLMRNDSSGLWVNPDVGDPFLYVPYPAEIGDSARFSFDGGGTYFTMKLEAKDVSVQTRSGVHSCWLYKDTRMDRVFEYYYKPGIGLIWQTNIALSSPPRITETQMLLDFAVN